jgi:hypothetical protein
MSKTDPDLQVATTIYQQLGGRRFGLMTGAKDFISDKDTLRFTIGQNSEGINRVEVTLTPNDEYDIRFLRVRKKRNSWEYVHTVVSAVEGIHGEDLVRVFADHTGLRTSL